MEKSKSSNLSKGDIISVIAILILGIAVFFGMNFKTLGDKVPSLVVAILLVVLMTIFVFLAAHAKAQNRNQDMWKTVEYTMLGLYIVALVPCYIFAAKFFDIQFSKQTITATAQDEIDSINKLFTEYNKKCDSRGGSYQTALEAMAQDAQGRARIARLLDIDVKSINSAIINQAGESFRKSLKGTDYNILKTEKESLETRISTNFKNWNILFIPQDVAELDGAKIKYAKKLQENYSKKKNELEQTVPQFDISEYETESNIASMFTQTSSFSVVGIISVIVLGLLGLVKYILGEKRTVIPLSKRDDIIMDIKL